MVTPIIISHPTGNSNVRHAAQALHEGGMLDTFVTSIAINPDSSWLKLLPVGFSRELRRRAFPSGVAERTKIHPWREAGRMISAKLRCKALTKHETGIFSIDSVWQSQDQWLANLILNGMEPSGIYAYEDGAEKTFLAAKSKGIRCLYDLPIGYWRAGRAIQQEEAERRPDWAMTMPALIDSEAKLERKDKELQQADAITVASSFTRQTLASAPFPLPPVTVIPYGGPCLHAVNVPPKHRVQSQPLRVLFVGSLGQRKGLADLLEAVNALERGVELTLIGQPTSTECAPMMAALRNHRWIPSMSHQAILDEMSNHDVFVFPSLFEGFGLVILEAMSRGLPVITTSHTAGLDIITDGIDGYIVPIRSPGAIQDRLELLRTDTGLLISMSEEARKTAGKFTWEHYRQQLIQWVYSCLQSV